MTALTSPPMDEAALRSALASSGFIRLAGIDLVRASDSGLVLRMPFHSGLERSDGSGQFHGGAVAALVDTAACFVVVMALNGPAPTVNLRTDYLRPALTQALTATAVVRRQGRTVAVVDVDVEDFEGRLVAIGRGSFATGGAT